MSDRVLWAFTLWVYTLGNLPGASNQTLCGRPHEEGTSLTLTCSTQDQAFDKFGPRIKTADGRMFETGYCDSNGKCQDSNPSQFEAFFSHDIISSTKAVTVRVKNVQRGMTGMLCYMNGTPLFETECIMIVYVHPNKPVCGALEFRSVEGGTDAFLSCKTERTDLQTQCALRILVGGTEISKDNHRVLVETEDSEAVNYPGYRQLTCQFRIQLSGIQENTYTLIAVFNAHRPGIQIPTSLADPIPPLELKATALLSPSDSQQRETFDPKSGQLKLSIPVISNPPPNRYWLSVRPADSSAGSGPVSNQHYSVIYSSSAIETLTGTIELTVANTAVSGGHGTAIFTFVADNGVVGSSEFEFIFTADRYDLAPTQPNCKDPFFDDGGATAVFVCTSDRMHIEGTCSFKLMTETLILHEEPVTQTTNEDSTAYPGHKKTTCQLRLPVAGNRAGEYQFQVEITPSNSGRDLSTYATLPSLKLKPTTLQFPDDNNPVFSYPDSGKLVLDIHVTGSPEPNKVKLWVKSKSQTSPNVPLSSRDFRWTYIKTAGSGGGSIELSITGGLKPGGISYYTVRAENGVAGDTEFEYRFTVNDVKSSVLPYHEQSPVKNYYMLLIGLAVVSGLVIVILIVLVVLLLVRNRRRPEGLAPGDSSKPDEDVELEEHLTPGKSLRQT